MHHWLSFFFNALAAGNEAAMTDVIISFDSEDYLTPEAADAELWWADALSQRGIRGCFQLVGEMVRSLQRSGRQDVIDAIGRHEINCHTDFHSLPPTHPEALEHLSLDEGIAHVLKTEAPCMATLATTFGQWPCSYCSPGDSWTPATLLAMARMGLRVFCNDKLHNFRKTPYWYCGLLVAAYNLDFQHYYEDYQTGAFEADFQQLVDETPEDSVIILYTHPTRLVTSAFWDQVFKQGARPSRENWHSAPLRSADEISANKQHCEQFLDHLATRNDLRFIDFATLYAERSHQRRDLYALLSESGLRMGEEGALPLRISDEQSFMPSATFDGMTYDWLPYPNNFSGAALIEQASQLAWTAAPAVCEK